MPAMDFPFPALAGDKYPVPAIPNQPVYIFDGVKWTTHGDIVDDVIGASALIPLPDGVASTGTENNWSRGDHVHPALINDLVLTGNPTAPTPPLGDDDTSIATTAFVQSTVATTAIGTSVLVGSTAPAGAADNSLWFEDDTGRLYLFYSDGTGPAQWIAAAPVPDALTSRYGIYAAPYDAVAYNGMQLNGSFDVSQEKGASVTTVSDQYVCDGWKISFAGGMGISANNATGILIPGFPKFFNAIVTTAKASLAAADHAEVQTILEGYRVSRLKWGTPGAQPLTISFFSSHNRTGTYSVAVTNEAKNRCYVATYTQNLTNAWEYKTITIPGDTTGTWKTDNTVGLRINFTIAAGTSSMAPAATTWTAGGFIAASNQVNAVAATSDVFAITGVTVLPGTQAPTAELYANIMRPLDQELLICKRYFQKFTSIIVDTSAASHSTIFPVEMRIAPVVTGGGAGFAASNSNTVSAQFSQTTRAAQTLSLDARL